MPYRTTREWIDPRCFRCEAPIEYQGRGRGPKWCDDCRPWAGLGNALRNALRAIAECPGGRELDEARVAIAEIRERLNVGEDLFPLEGRGMSVAEYARKAELPREAWPELRALRGSAVR